MNEEIKNTVPKVDGDDNMVNASEDFNKGLANGLGVKKFDANQYKQNVADLYGSVVRTGLHDALWHPDDQTEQDKIFYNIVKDAMGRSQKALIDDPEAQIPAGLTRDDLLNDPQALFNALLMISKYPKN